MLQIPEFRKRYAQDSNPNPFDAAILTHAHMGHYAGLIHFGMESANAKAMPLYITTPMRKFLQSNQPWKLLVDNGNVECKVPVEYYPAYFRVFRSASPIRISFIVVPHRDEFGTLTIGVSIGVEESNATTTETKIKPKILYIPDIDRWDLVPEKIHEWIDAHEISILDACFYSGSELPGRDLAKIAHPLVTDSVKRFAKHLHNNKRIIFSHLNHSNPLVDPKSEESIAVTKLGFEIAQEMMELDIPCNVIK
eukprot:TRINITY_DN5956_c0_g1_i1.p1 TRINITY_DN5956_c0_g1~~TRINITY_DN5956_c0_g1_i1.p1  ORF type:complete len:251 (-),score=24.96 TRINITY_DN5956_c0_g1_i1:17-769(-)